MSKRGEGKGGRLPFVLGVVGVVLIVGAVLWWVLAVPALVKYPTDLDVTIEYEGTFTLYANPTTFAPLETPLELPLTVERHVEADGSESGSSLVVVNETIEQQAGDLLDSTQENRYVMDRRSNENVADDRAYAFEPENVVDRSPAFRLQLPFDTAADAELLVYKNETDDTYTLAGTGETEQVEGLTLAQFDAAADPVPLSDAYIAELRDAVPLPASLTLDQLKPQLATIGVDVDPLIVALLPQLTEADRDTLLRFAAAPVPLEYVLGFEGSVGVDRTTGSEVKINGLTETLGVRPAQEQLDTLRELLGRYNAVPAAVTASTALDALVEGDPIRVVSYTYAQTPASVADIAAEVKDQRDLIQLAERTVPIGLLIVGALLVIIAVVVFVLRRRRPSGPVDTPAQEPEPATHPAV